MACPSWVASSQLAGIHASRDLFFAAGSCYNKTYSAVWQVNHAHIIQNYHQLPGSSTMEHKLTGSPTLPIYLNNRFIQLPHGEV